MKSREVLRMLKGDGWVEQPRKATAHIQLKHPTKSGKVTVADHKGDLTMDEIKSIERQSGLKLRGR
jgi:predicted RNA binding protein YcfA (HicA-like mRNA interferase family)